MTLRPLATALAITAGLGLAVPSAASAAEPACPTWSKSTVASGLGVLENLAFDGRGGLLLSSQTLLGPGGAIKRVSAGGASTTAVSNVTGPGGIVVDGRTAYFATGNSASSGVLGLKDGTIQALDLDTGAVRTTASGLTQPNGLERLPDGTFVVSRDLGLSTTMTRVAPSGELSTYAPSISSTNGLAYDASRHRLYVASTFNPTTTISGVDVRRPDAPPTVATLPGIGPLNSADDLTVGADGQVYVALNLAGKIVRVDPDTGTSCTIASGLPTSSSVAFGSGPGWDAGSLYVTSFLGTVTRLTP
ncbi:SMP-30/gluconolactonase/LRE family protein [Luteipulveratus mongoliensis]|uniref:SMP-30/Gluconolactonase/LRE-like region domain-containing protein n=1 Tax=Luteipulveratus mongoliensis TaxID=571913 RepID=A0A0K1JF09_9MICO|nr:SMP-30/gluconolactonase/LRE family protein [Luteipulveratus mongoliensis]AKU15302.1 hypothetical protein VV02_04550 [Luteipulveratus mongoliensis]